MPPEVFAAILVAASLHAGWNAIVKGGGEPLLSAVLVSLSAAAIAAAALPFAVAPARESWPFIAASTALQIVYYRLLARAYGSGEMSLVYPLMRGAAPLVVALAGWLVLRDALSPAAWLGVGLLSSGVLATARARPRAGPGGEGKAIRLALANAAVIAGYTLVDGIGARRSGAPLGYALWVILLPGLAMAGWALARARAAFLAHARRRWPRELAGGFATLASYALALWAMTLAPIAAVAALRETAILFGLGLAWLLFGERPGPARIAGTFLVFAGAALIRLG